MTNSTKNNTNKPGLKVKLEDEMKKALELTIYFGSWFCAKFMLIAQAAYPIKVDKKNGIVGSLFFESIVYIIVIIALNFIEAGVDGLINGKEFIPSMTAFGSGDPLRVLAMSIMYWLIVWPYLIFVGFNKVVGNTETLAVLFGSKK